MQYYQVNKRIYGRKDDKSFQYVIMQVKYKCITNMVNKMNYKIYPIRLLCVLTICL